MWTESVQLYTPANHFPFPVLFYGSRKASLEKGSLVKTLRKVAGSRLERFSCVSWGHSGCIDHWMHRWCKLNLIPVSGWQIPACLPFNSFHNSGKTRHHIFKSWIHPHPHTVHAGLVAKTCLSIPQTAHSPSLSNERHKGGRTFLRSRGRGGCRTCGNRETQMGGCFLSSVTAYKHTQTIKKKNKNLSTAADVIKCWQDCCVHYSNAAMHSQRWVFRTMPSLINQSEPLRTLPRWLFCCSLWWRHFGKLWSLTATVCCKRIFNPSFLNFPLARHEDVTSQAAEVFWQYNKDKLCCRLWFSGV